MPLIAEEARMNVRYRVELSQSERAELASLLSGGTDAVRKLKPIFYSWHGSMWPKPLILLDVGWQLCKSVVPRFRLI
jgi:hypothetical protein